MNKHINFEDNIFILNMRVRMIRDLLLLETDSELFLRKTVEDMKFIDTILAAMLKNLTENVHLIERNEQFDNLSEIEWQFSQVLSLFLDGSGNISAEHCPEFRKDITYLSNQSLGRKQTIDTLSNSTIVTEPLVSSLEMNALLASG
ncbi:MAG: hypothetical protein LBS86_04385 [Treponema sp.]|nr:hypothetical protein [Treponema sp.]